MSVNEGALLRKYVASFNDHDLEAVMHCFDADAVVIDNEGHRREGRDAIRGSTVRLRVRERRSRLLGRKW